MKSSDKECELFINTEPINCKLRELPDIFLKKVSNESEEKLWNYLVSEYHYLSYSKMFGERIKYIILSNRIVIGAISFNQGTIQIKARDKYVRWTKKQRNDNLHVVANNNRFLILPWVKVKYLASHVLSIAIKQVKKDWEKSFGVKLLLLETFVDNSKYRGTSYLAANWIYVGKSSGYSKVRDGSYVYHGNKKGIYLYILNKNFRKILNCEEIPEKKASRIQKIEEELIMLAHKMEWEPDLLEKIGVTPDNAIEISNKFIEYYCAYKDTFNRISQKMYGLMYLMGLMSKLPRKSLEPIALSYSKNTNVVRYLQLFVTDSPWDEKKMANIYRSRLSDRINDEDGMITFDETDFMKKGKNSAGVMRQYCGIIGATTNCQAGIFMGYAGKKGYGLIEGNLYIPKRWFEEGYDNLREKCKFPEEVTYKDKCTMCSELLEKVIKEKSFSAKWVGCDTTFGSSHEFRHKISEMGLYYFADVRSNMCIWPEMPAMRESKQKSRNRTENKKIPLSKPISIKDFLNQDSESPWIETVLAEGSKGPIRSHIKLFRVYENVDGQPGGEVWLFARKYANDELKTSFCNAPEDTPSEIICNKSLSRWSIEQCFEECKTELGMANYEVRSYNGWHRHMLFVMMAHEFLCEVQNIFKKNLKLLMV